MTHAHHCFGAAIWLSLLLLACGCASPDRLLEPQELGGDIATALRAPVVFARDAPGVSVTGRDYTYFGPVEIDDAGSRQVLLWVGLASSIDRIGAPHPLADATGIVVHLDELSVQLPLSPWGLGQAPFHSRVPLLEAFYAPVGKGLLARIAQSRSLEVEWVSARKRLYRYAHWRGQWPDWQEIEADTSLGLRVNVFSGEPGR